ncbi:MAG: exodeoxyribonuclease VII large subunit, partial [Verrucomicrobia bacterium]|nr:exodeoxyribonuclease VII large subunit [Verrucomicrobiota bacterium]
RPSAVLARWRRDLADWRRRLPRAAAQDLGIRRPRVARLAAGLRMLSPEQVLQRGYSITLDAATGTVVRSPSEVGPGRRLQTRVRDGEIGSVVSEPPPAVR